MMPVPARRTLLALLCALACLAPVAAQRTDVSAVEQGASIARSARTDRWRVVGPGGGGTTLHPVISPHDSNVAAQTCDMTGSYLTVDGGVSWRMFNLGTGASAFAFDPNDPSVIYAAASAIFRSDDRGKTWAMVFPDPARNTVANGWGDHAETVYTTDDPLYPSGQDVVIHAIGVDESDSNRLFAAIQARKPGPPGSSEPETTTVLASANRGRTWTAIGDLPAQRVFAIWAGIAGGPVQLLAEEGVFVRAGDRWRRGPAPAGVRFDSGSVGRDAEVGATLVYATAPLEAGEAGVRGGMYVSRDSGAHWVEANGRLSELFGDAVGRGETWGPAHTSRPRLGPVSASARHGLTAYVGLRGLRAKDGDGKPFNGVARTADGGRTWTIVHRESDRPAANFEPSWIEARAVEDGRSVWLDAPYDIGAAPSDPLVCHVTDLFRTYRTTDGGRTWAQVNSARANGDAWVSRGLDVTTHYGMAWDPFDPKHVLVATTDIGLFGSEDGGATWIGSSSGIPRPWRNTAYWVVFDPEVKGLVWGGFSGTHDLPRPKMWRRTDPASFRGGVAVSTDGGRNWTPSNGAMAESAVTHLILDPRSPKGQRTLYAAAFGRGVYKSIDNGRTWTLKNAGLAPDPREQPFAWRLAQDPAGLLYLVVARRSERGRIGNADDGALYVSSDGADHWRKLDLPPGVNGPNGLAIDPREPRRLYLSAWAVATPGGDTGGGIFISDDGGGTWRRARGATGHVYDVTIDPRNPDVMYACGFDQAVLRSVDRGETWHRVPGFNFKWGHRVVIDPADPSSIYVTTFGGGVWHGPAAGDATSTEDVTTGRERLARLVEANIAGVHAFQVLLARRSGKGDAACYAGEGLTDAQLEALVEHQAALLASDRDQVAAWAAGQASSFDPAKDLAPLESSGLKLSERLPVNVFAADLSRQKAAPPLSLRAIANLYQTVLEVERDGDLLQDLYRFYIALGLPVYLGPLGLSGSDAAMLEAGRRLEGRACASPFGLTAAEWQLAGRKIWNWGEKNLRVRDAHVLAGELLEEPDVARLIPGMRAMPAQRVAVIGHSFTMDLHWSSPSAFAPIVEAMFQRENPAVAFRFFQGGGLTSSRALKRFYQDVLAWKPQTVLLVVANRTEEDFEALKTMVGGLKAAGARVFVFDDVLDPLDREPEVMARQAAVARSSGAIVVEVRRLLEASPDRGRFLCLDGIHMTEPYHRLMAKQWLALLAGANGGAGRASEVPPVEAFTVLDPQPPAGPRITPYLRYQLDRAWAQDSKRLADWAAVRNEADLEALKRRTRERLLAAIGGLPNERTPLNARIVGTVPAEGYRIEKVIFESVPGLHVPALLYLPDGPARPRPAVLLPCGHSPLGKAFRNYQEIAVRLVRRGYVVLCWDPVGQGERSQFWDEARGRSRYNLVCGEHAVLGNLACLAGANLARWEAWDGIRALDYLLTRPEVDRRRVAITGTSGGGFQSATIGALDERIAVVAPSCYITSLPMRMANRIFEDPDSDPEQDPYGSVSGGIDHPGLLLLVHPRPLIVASAVKDFVPIEGARRTFREIEAIYRRFGGAGRVAMVEGYHEHRFSDENQDAVFAFLDRFNGLSARHGFEPFTPLPAEALRCTATGQVRVDLEDDRPLVEIIRDYHRATRGSGAGTLGALYRSASFPRIDAWPVVPWDRVTPRAAIAWEARGTTAVGGISIDRYVVRHSGGLVMPLLHVHPTGVEHPTATPARPVLLDLSLDGKATPADWAALRARLDAGFDVVSFDLRGTGETRMRYRAASVDDPTLAPADEEAAYADPLSGVLANYVYNSLLTGRPYFLEMLEDVEVAARFSRAKLGAARVAVAGRGDASLLARAAGDVLPGVEWIPGDPADPAFSWSEAVESLTETWPIQYLLPGGARLR